MIGPLPPPVGGQSVLVRSILDSALSRQYSMQVLNIAHGNMNSATRLLLTLANLSKLMRLLQQTPRLQLIHVHSSAGAPLFEKGIFIVAARLYRRKVLLHIHGGIFRSQWPRYGAGRRWLTRAILRQCHGLVILSDDWLSFYREELEYEGELFSLPNSVNVPERSEKEDDGIVRLLYVGHLKREKGLIDLRDAVRDLPKSSKSRLEVLLVGEGDTKTNENCIREAFANLASPRIVFLGPLDGEEKWAAFRQADILILASHSEDFPLSLLEGMGCGLPVVATRVGAIPSMLSDGVEGRLVDAHDVSELRKILIDLLSSKEKRLIMGRAALLKYQSKYSFEKYTERLSDIYTNLLTA